MWRLVHSMPFKKNEPGCKCCGYGLYSDYDINDGEAGRFRIERLIPSDNANFGLMRESTEIRLDILYGAGTKVVGVDAEGGHILFRKTNGSIWAMRSTGAVFELWNTSTDIASLDIMYMCYQRSYGYAGGYTETAEGFVVDDSGTFTTSPFAMPLPTFVDRVFLSVAAVDTDGNLYAGVTSENFGASGDTIVTSYLLKNGVRDAYCSYERSGSVIIEGGLLIDPGFIICKGTQLILAVAKVQHLGNIVENHFVEVSSGQEITLDDSIFTLDDVVGRDVNHNFYFGSSYNAITGVIDFSCEAISGCQRINENLNINSYLRYILGRSIKIIVTKPEN